jgi:hypothetical protein
MFGGVDTDKDCQVAAVVDDKDLVLGTTSFTATWQGYRQMHCEMHLACRLTLGSHDIREPNGVAFNNQ